MTKYQQINFEEEARKFFGEYESKTGESVTFPVPIERLIEIVTEFGVLYDSSELAQDESGRVDFREKLITIREDEAEVRQRFSLGHEVGHVRLHKPQIDLQTIPIRGLLEDGSYTHLSRRRSEEWFEVEANQFSATVLMPMSLLRPAFDQVRQEYSLHSKTPNEILVMLEQHLASLCHVSRESMRIRLKTTGLDQELWNYRLF